VAQARRWRWLVEKARDRKNYGRVGARLEESEAMFGKRVGRGTIAKGRRG